MNNNYRIFICTHKDIPFDYKKIGVNKKHYTILSQVKGVEPNGCDVIDISDDDFVKRFKICFLTKRLRRGWRLNWCKINRFTVEQFFP